MSPNFVEAIKELLRTWALAIIAALVVAIGMVVQGISTSTGEFAINWPVVVAIVATGALTGLQTAIASAVDKFLHKSGVETPLDLESLDSLKKTS